MNGLPFISVFYKYYRKQIFEYMVKSYNSFIAEKKDSEDMKYKLSLLINRLYDASRPYTMHKYSDSGWENAHAHIHALEKIDGVTGVYRSSGVYRNYFAGKSESYDKSAYREYDLDITTKYGNIGGRLICHSAGEVDDVFSEYDMTCTFWEKE